MPVECRQPIIGLVPIAGRLFERRGSTGLIPAGRLTWIGDSLSALGASQQPAGRPSSWGFKLLRCPGHSAGARAGVPMMPSPPPRQRQRFVFGQCARPPLARRVHSFDQVFMARSSPVEPALRRLRAAAARVGTRSGGSPLRCGWTARSPVDLGIRARHQGRPSLGTELGLRFGSRRLPPVQAGYVVPSVRSGATDRGRPPETRARRVDCVGHSRARCGSPAAVGLGDGSVSVAELESVPRNPRPLDSGPAGPFS
jgi:hypothetical protein